MQPDQQPPDNNGYTPGGNEPFTQSTPTQSVTRKSKKKLLVWIIIAVAVVLAGAAAYAFGYYLPNKPENVWSSGFDRTGKALASMNDRITDEKQLDAYKQSNVTAKMSYKTNDGSYSGTLDIKLDDTKTDGKLDVKLAQKDKPQETVGLKFITDLKNTAYPDIYLQLYGLQTSLGKELETFVPGIAAYDSKWIYLDPEYLQSLAAMQGLAPAEEASPKDKSKEITAKDASKFAATLTDTVNEYVFTSDPKKAVIERRTIVGEETVEGLKAYRYKAGIHKTHAKDFCEVLTARLYESDLYKKSGFYDADQAKERKETEVKKCKENTDKIENDQTFDVWVDTKYKLIRKIRVTDTEDKGRVVEISQKYTGGDDIPLSLTWKDAKAKESTRLELATNLKTSLTTMSVHFASAAEGKEAELTFELTAKPIKGKFEIKKPANPVQLQEVLKALGIDSNNLTPTMMEPEPRITLTSPVGGTYSDNVTVGGDDVHQGMQIAH